MNVRILWGMIGAKLILFMTLATSTVFVMDEMHFLGMSLQLVHGIYDTIWPNKAVGYSVVYGLAHIVGWDAVSTLISGRLVAATVTCVSLWLVYALTINLGGDRRKALIIVFLLLCFSTFMERAFRTRAEPIGLLFGLASLFIVVRGDVDRRLVVFAAGIVCGLAFVVHQKAAYYDLALGIALVGDAFIRRRFFDGIKRGALLVAGWASIISLYSLYFGGLGFFAVLESLFIGPSALAAEGATYYRNSTFRTFLIQTLARNGFLYVLCFFGLSLSLSRIHQLDAQNRISLIFSIVISVLIFNLDQTWPYVFIMAIPFMTLWILVPIEFSKPQSVQRFALISLLAVSVMLSFVANFRYLTHTNSGQLDVVRRAESLLESQDTYLDFVGMLPNRYQTANMWIDQMRLAKIQVHGVASPYMKSVYDSAPKVIIESYRSKSISKEINPFVQGRYVRIYPNILVAGRTVDPGKAIIFDVPSPGKYRLYSETGIPLDEPLTINGNVTHPPFNLVREKYSIYFDGNERLRYVLPEELPLDLSLPAENSVVLFPNVYR